MNDSPGVALRGQRGMVARPCPTRAYVAPSWGRASHVALGPIFEMGLGCGRR